MTCFIARVICSLWGVAITVFFIVCFEAVASGLDDVPNNRSKCADVPGIRLPFNYNLAKNNFSEIRISRPTL